MMVPQISVSQLSSRAKRGICIAWIMLTVSPVFGQGIFPNGWRRITQAEAADDWRQKSRTRYLLVKGDFDGDGKSDTAELLLNPSANQFALFVKLASSAKWQMLGEPFDVKVLDRFGIDLVKPGKYQTACGKGYGDYACAHGEPNFLLLSAPGIDLFYTESLDSIFYWDRKSGKFVEVLMSD